MSETVVRDLRPSREEIEMFIERGRPAGFQSVMIQRFHGRASFLSYRTFGIGSTEGKLFQHEKHTIELLSLKGEGKLFLLKASRLIDPQSLRSVVDGAPKHGEFFGKLYQPERILLERGVRHEIPAGTAFAFQGKKALDAVMLMTKS